MTTENRTDRISRAGVGAIVFSSVSVLLPVVIGLLFSGFIKRENPNDVDVTNGLAYLSEILTVSWSAIIAFLVVAIVVNVFVVRKDTAGGVIAFVVLALQIVCGVLLLLATGFSNVTA